MLLGLISVTGLTQRAPDWWDSHRQKGVNYAQANSVKAATSRPAHQRVTQTVRQRNDFCFVTIVMQRL